MEEGDSFIASFILTIGPQKAKNKRCDGVEVVVGVWGMTQEYHRHATDTHSPLSTSAPSVP